MTLQLTLEHILRDAIIAQNRSKRATVLRARARAFRTQLIHHEITEGKNRRKKRGIPSLSKFTRYKLHATYLFNVQRLHRLRGNSLRLRGFHLHRRNDDFRGGGNGVHDCFLLFVCVFRVRREESARAEERRDARKFPRCNPKLSHLLLEEGEEFSKKKEKKSRARTTL